MVEDSNATNPPIDPTLTADSVVFTFFLIIGDAVAIVSNTLVITVVFTNYRMKTNSNFLIVSLCVSHLLTGITSTPLVLDSVLKGGWSGNAGLCQAAVFFDILSTCSSIANAGAVAVDRFHSIVNCLTYETLVTATRTYIVIACIWIQSTLLAILPLTGWGIVDYDHNFFQCIVLPRFSTGYIYLNTTVAFLLPLVIILYCYTKIHIVARRHARSITDLQIQVHNSSGNAIKTERPRSSSRVKLVFMVVGIFIMSWVPEYTVRFYMSFGFEAPRIIASLSTIFSVLSCTLDPLVYALLTGQFRTGLRRLRQKILRAVQGRGSRVSPHGAGSRSTRSISRFASNMFNMHSDKGLSSFCVHESAIAVASQTPRGSCTSLGNSQNIECQPHEVYLQTMSPAQMLEVPKIDQRTVTVPVANGYAEKRHSWTKAADDSDQNANVELK